jgi:hypothetical protein
MCVNKYVLAKSYQPPSSCKMPDLSISPFMSKQRWCVFHSRSDNCIALAPSIYIYTVDVLSSTFSSSEQCEANVILFHAFFFSPRWNPTTTLHRLHVSMDACSLLCETCYCSLLKLWAYDEIKERCLIALKTDQIDFPYTKEREEFT